MGGLQHSLTNSWQFSEYLQPSNSISSSSQAQRGLGFFLISTSHYLARPGTHFTQCLPPAIPVGFTVPSNATTAWDIVPFKAILTAPLCRKRSVQMPSVYKWSHRLEGNFDSFKRRLKWERQSPSPWASFDLHLVFFHGCKTEQAQMWPHTINYESMPRKDTVQRRMIWTNLDDI